jgi:tetratricopeptide (TPR) repeat protein
MHHFLSWALDHGAHVFTTNFDGLIEDAHRCRGGTPLQVFVDEQRGEQDDLPNTSFESYLLHGLPRPAVLKLHGTLRARTHDGSEREQFGSVGATLDRIGSSSATPRLEAFKHEVLRATLHNRILCVLGYSGTDDFDVIPSLASLLPDSANLIWIRHEDHSPEVLDITQAKARDAIPPPLRSSASRLGACCVHGRTDEAIELLFGYSRVVSAVRPPANFEERLAAIPTYRCLTPIQKKIVVGRIAERAGQNILAAALYQEVVSMALRRDPTSSVYALFRTAHLHRIQGRFQEALVELKRALSSVGSERDRENRVHVLNALGNVYLDRGALNKAETYYQRALGAAMEAGNRRFQASVITNLGNISKRRGDYDTALEWYDAALAIDFEIREKTGIARELGNKANVFVLQGRYAEALATLEEGIQLQRLLGRLDLLAMSLETRSTVNRRLGHLDDAEADASQAETIERELGRSDGIARCLCLLAEVWAQREEWDRAITQLLAATSIQERIGHREALAMGLETLGECYSRSGDREAAAVALHRSQKLYASLGNRRKARELQRSIRLLETTTAPLRE